MRRGRPDQDRDALPAGRLRHLRRLPGRRVSTGTPSTCATRDKNIADVLDMTVEQAAALLREHPGDPRSSRRFCDVGLGYIRLGQSGHDPLGRRGAAGEARASLAKRATGHTLYILDEPTTGLHFADIQKLLDVLMRSGRQGNTVVVIEHNLERRDRRVRHPEEVAGNPRSFTGRFLRRVLHLPLPRVRRWSGHAVDGFSRPVPCEFACYFLGKRWSTSFPPPRRGSGGSALVLQAPHLSMSSSTVSTPPRPRAGT